MCRLARVQEGVRTLSGVEQAVIQNCQACKALSDVTRTSLGPTGLFKMVVNHLGKIFVTTDTSTILKELEVQHPAAKLLVMAAHQLELEVGDGSNFVIMVGGELLAQAEELIRMGLHPSEVIAGYARASKEVLRVLDTLEVLRVENKQFHDVETLTRCVRTAIASKQYGQQDVIAPLVAQACAAVMPANQFNFNVDNVRVVKVLGSQLNKSEVVRGMVVAHDAITAVREVRDAKVAVFSCSIGAVDTETKGTVLIESAQQLMSFNAGEEKQIESAILAIQQAGANVIITGGTVDDIALHYIDKYKMMCIKVTSKFELRRLCKAMRARPMVQMSDVRPEELGYCAHVYVREVGSTKLTVFTQEQRDASAMATILLRASTNNILNDIERAIDDGVNVVKAMTRDARFVAGAGACEAELSRQLRAVAQSVAGVEQYALHKFADALEVVPRTLAENAGADAMAVVSQIMAAHERGERGVGVDVESGSVSDQSATVLDLMSSKVQGVRLMMDAVLTILRVDAVRAAISLQKTHLPVFSCVQIIQAKPAGGPKMPKQQGHWDDNE